MAELFKHDGTVNTTYQFQADGPYFRRYRTDVGDPLTATQEFEVLESDLSTLTNIRAKDPSDATHVATKNYADTLPGLLTVAQQAAFTNAPGTAISGGNPLVGQAYVDAIAGGDISNTGAGYVTVNDINLGTIYSSGRMDTTDKYTPGPRFASTDSSLSTENPKILAGIAGYAEEGYSTDTDGGMGISIYTTANNPGANPVAIERVRFRGDGTTEFDGNVFLTGTSYLQSNKCLRVETNAIPAAVTNNMAGMELYGGSGVDVDLNELTPAIKFGWGDTSFSTLPTKVTALIVGRATENYTADDDGGTALDFYVQGNNPGATPTWSTPTMSLESSLATINTDLNVTGNFQIAKMFVFDSSQSALDQTNTFNNQASALYLQNNSDLDAGDHGAALYFSSQGTSTILDSAPSVHYMIQPEARNNHNGTSDDLWLNIYGSRGLEATKFKISRIGNRDTDYTQWYHDFNVSGGLSGRTLYVYKPSAVSFTSSSTPGQEETKLILMANGYPTTDDYNAGLYFANKGSTTNENADDQNPEYQFGIRHVALNTHDGTGDLSKLTFQHFSGGTTATTLMDINPTSVDIFDALNAVDDDVTIKKLIITDPNSTSNPTSVTSETVGINFRPLENPEDGDFFPGMTWDNQFGDASAAIRHYSNETHTTTNTRGTLSMYIGQNNVLTEAFRVSNRNNLTGYVTSPGFAESLVNFYVQGNKESYLKNIKVQDVTETTNPTSFDLSNTDAALTLIANVGEVANDYLPPILFRNSFGDWVGAITYQAKSTHASGGGTGDLTLRVADNESQRAALVVSNNASVSGYNGSGYIEFLAGGIYAQGNNTLYVEQHEIGDVDSVVNPPAFANISNGYIGFRTYAAEVANDYSPPMLFFNSFGDYVGGIQYRFADTHTSGSGKGSILFRTFENTSFNAGIELSNRSDLSGYSNRFLRMDNNTDFYIQESSTGYVRKLNVINVAQTSNLTTPSAVLGDGINIYSPVEMAAGDFSPAIQFWKGDLTQCLAAIRMEALNSHAPSTGEKGSINFYTFLSSSTGIPMLRLQDQFIQQFYGRITATEDNSYTGVEARRIKVYNRHTYTPNADINSLATAIAGSIDIVSHNIRDEVGEYGPVIRWGSHSTIESSSEELDIARTTFMLAEKNTDVHQVNGIGNDSVLELYGNLSSASSTATESLAARFYQDGKIEFGKSLSAQELWLLTNRNANSEDRASFRTQANDAFKYAEGKEYPSGTITGGDENILATLGWVLDRTGDSSNLVAVLQNNTSTTSTTTQTRSIVSALSFNNSNYPSGNYDIFVLVNFTVGDRLNGGNPTLFELVIEGATSGPNHEQSIEIRDDADANMNVMLMNYRRNVSASNLDVDVYSSCAGSTTLKVNRDGDGRGSRCMIFVFKLNTIDD